MHSKTTNTKGITLVEVLITLIIAAFLAAATLAFVNISSKSTDELAAQQVLQQESSMISELFLRYVRRGSKVAGWDGSAFIIPTTNPLDVKRIKVNYPDPTKIVEFQIFDNMMQITEGTRTRNVSTRLCTAKNTKSIFTIAPPNGKGVRLTLTLEYTTKITTHLYTTTIGSVRCKN